MELDPDQQQNRGLREAMASWFGHPASWFLVLCASFAGLELLAPHFDNLTGPARGLAWVVGVLAVLLFARGAFAAGKGRKADSDQSMQGTQFFSHRLLATRDSSDRKDIEEQLRRLAFHDPLTLLANRALFRDRV